MKHYTYLEATLFEYADGRICLKSDVTVFVGTTLVYDVHTNETNRNIAEAQWAKFISNEGITLVCEKTIDETVKFITYRMELGE